MKTSEKCPDCNRINEVLTRVGDRWSVLVIISLAEYGTLRFNELKRNLGISQRMLSLTLKSSNETVLLAVPITRLSRQKSNIA